MIARERDADMLCVGLMLVAGVKARVTSAIEGSIRLCSAGNNFCGDGGDGDEAIVGHQMLQHEGYVECSHKEIERGRMPRMPIAFKIVTSLRNFDMPDMPDDPHFSK